MSGFGVGQRGTVHVEHGRFGKNGERVRSGTSAVRGGRACVRGGLVGRGLAVCVVGWGLFFVFIAKHALGVPLFWLGFWVVGW